VAQTAVAAAVGHRTCVHVTDRPRNEAPEELVTRGGGATTNASDERPPGIASTHVSTTHPWLSVAFPEFGTRVQWTKEELARLCALPAVRTSLSTPLPFLPTVGWSEALAELAGQAKASTNAGINRAEAVVLLLYLLAMMPMMAGSGRTCTIVATSSVPTGRGMGSSAAFSVAMVAAALVSTGVVEVDPETGFSDAALEVVANPEITSGQGCKGVGGCMYDSGGGGL